MIRLLIVLIVVALATYVMLNQQRSVEKPEVIYKQEFDKVKGLEQQMKDDAARQLEEIDSLSK